MRNVIILILVFSTTSFSLFSQQQSKKAIVKDIVTYGLPAIEYNITVVFKIKNVRIYNKANNTLLRQYSEVNIDDPIKIESKLFTDTLIEFDLSTIDKKGKNFEFTVNMDTNGNGLINSINGNQSSVAAEVITSGMGFLTTLVGAVAKLYSPGFTPSATENEKVVEEEQKVEVSRNYDFSSQNPLIITLDLKTPYTKTISLVSPAPDKTEPVQKPVQIPVVKVSFSIINNKSFSPYNKTVSGRTQGKSSDGIVDFWYRIPSLYKMKVEIIDLGMLANQTVLERDVLVPQKGILTSVPIPLLKGNRNYELAFNSLTGNISKYSLKRESTTAASITKLNESTEKLLNEVNNLRNEIEKSKSNSIQSEINLLDLKLKLLEAEKKLKEANSQPAGDSSN